MLRGIKDFFVPHTGNNYKPHSLQTAAVGGMAILIVLSFAIVNVQSILWVSSEWMISTILPSVIVERTNDERSSGALSSLRRSPVLDRAAQMKAEHMAEMEYFAHYSPSGISPWYWFDEARYTFVHAGENLAIHFSDSGEIVDAWMNSPLHRDNIMNSDFREIGIGTARGMYEGYETVYVVQLFGTPAVVNTTSPLESDVSSADADIVAVDTPTAVAGASSTDTVVAGAQIHTTEIDIEEVVTTDDTVSLYSGTLATTTNGVPASIDATLSESTPPVGIIGFATQPRTILQFVYALVALFVVLALIVSTFIEVRRQHPVQLAYSVGLVVTMALLLHLHLTLTAGAVIV